jgi:hypothetical protein
MARNFRPGMDWGSSCGESSHGSKSICLWILTAALRTAVQVTPQILPLHSDSLPLRIKGGRIIEDGLHHLTEPDRVLRKKLPWTVEVMMQDGYEDGLSRPAVLCPAIPV